MSGTWCHQWSMVSMDPSNMFPETSPTDLGLQTIPSIDWSVKEGEARWLVTSQDAA